MKTFFNPFIWGAICFAFFAYALIDLLLAEKRIGWSPVNSWAILSPAGRVAAVACFVMIGSFVIGYMIAMLIKYLRK